MKNLKTVLLLVFTTIAFNASATQYIIIKPAFFGYKLVYVAKPADLSKWHYDSKNDVYYRGNTVFGTPLPIKIKNRG